MPRIGILDYKVGNVFSLKTSLEKVSSERVEILSSSEGLKDLDALALPGVGHFAPASKVLNALRDPIEHFLKEGGFLLGVCLGIQLLAKTSEEGNAEGLGFIRGNVLRLPASVKVPHIGWNSVKLRKDHKMLKGLDDESYFYFAHSYHLNLGDIDIVYGWTNYGVSFPSIVVKGNIVGTQFHPEKSGMKGLRFLRNFVEELR